MSAIMRKSKTSVRNGTRRGLPPLSIILLSIALISSASDTSKAPKLGKQADGTFIVSTQQRLNAGAISFPGRPIDMAMHPSGEFAAILNHSNTFLVSHDGVLPKSGIYTQGAGYRGVVWSPDGSKLYVSCARGVVQELLYHSGHLSTERGNRCQKRLLEAKSTARRDGDYEGRRASFCGRPG